MKKAVALVMALVMVLALSATAFAAGGPLTLEQAKQAALDFAGVKATEANVIKAHPDMENGRQVYEIEFCSNGTRYHVDVDMNTGEITAFSTGYCECCAQPTFYFGGRDWDVNWDYLLAECWDDMYDDDDWFDDMFDWDD